MLGKSVKFSPDDGNREMGKKVSALREPATRMERIVFCDDSCCALLSPLHDVTMAEMERRARNSSLAIIIWDVLMSRQAHRRLAGSRDSCILMLCCIPLLSFHLQFPSSLRSQNWKGVGERREEKRFLAFESFKRLSSFSYFGRSSMSMHLMMNDEPKAKDQRIGGCT